MPPSNDRVLKIQELAKAIRGVERAHHARLDTDRIIPTGISPLDGLLADGGLHSGSLVEWLVPGEGCGADTLAFVAMRSILQTDGKAIVVDVDGTLFPPALDAIGIDPDRLVIVRTNDPADGYWAMEQCLACRQVALVIGWPRELTNIAYSKNSRWPPRPAAGSAS